VFALHVGFLAVLSKHQVYAVVGAFRCFNDGVALAFVGFGGEGLKLPPGQAADFSHNPGLASFFKVTLVFTGDDSCGWFVPGAGWVEGAGMRGLWIPARGPG